MTRFFVSLLAAGAATGALAGAAWAQDATPSDPDAQPAAEPAAEPASGPGEDISRYFADELELIDAGVLEQVESGDVDAPRAAPSQGELGALSIEDAFNEAQIAFARGDFALAQLYAETAAIGGHARAATIAGLIQADGLAGPRDPSAAVRWLSRAAEQDEPVALFNLGQIAQAAEGGLAPVSARGYFQRAAQIGHIDAMVAYALTLKSSPIPSDKDEALVWAERAALQGSPEGMYQYAILLDGWPYGPQSVADALTWYRRASDEGHVEASFEAALILAAGADGVDVDEAEALRRMRIAAETGYAPAEGQLGLMLIQGFGGGDADEAEAASWIRQGAEGGDPESQFLFAALVGRGVGVESDYEEAYFWVLHAAHDSAGAPVYNPQREAFQAVLESDLPPSVVERVRARVAQTGGVIAD